MHTGFGVGPDLIYVAFPFMSLQARSEPKPRSVSSVAGAQRDSMDALSPVPDAATRLEEGKSGGQRESEGAFLPGGGG